MIYTSFDGGARTPCFNVRRLLAAAIALLALAVMWSGSLTGGQITADALHNLNMGVNLSHEGVISGSRDGPVMPSMYREPLPAVSTAIGVAVVDALMGEAETSAYSSGQRAKYLKYQNLFWATVMTVALLGLLFSLTNSFPVALVGAVAANLPIPAINRPNLDTLLTEPVAGSLLCIVALALASWAHRGSRRLLFLAGLAFGLLALTKASFLYVFLGMLLALPVIQLFFRPEETRQWARRNPGKLLSDIMVLAVAFSVVVFPWMWRNYMHFGDFGISERAGVILMQRAVFNGLNEEEYLGALYVFAPNAPLKSVVGRITGFTPADLRRGGPLQRLNHGKDSGFSEEDLAAEQEGRPEDAISYHRRARAWRIKLANEHKAAGHPRPWSVADDELQVRAMKMIRDDIGNHIAWIPLAMWRGALVTTPILLVALAVALRSRRNDMALVVLPSLGMTALYALATPFEARMGMTVMPLATAVLFALLFQGWRRLRRATVGRRHGRVAA